MEQDVEAEAQAAAATLIGKVYRGKKAREEHIKRRSTRKGVYRRREAPSSHANLPSIKGQIIDRAERILSDFQLADCRAEHLPGMVDARALIFLTQLRSGAPLASSAAAGFIIRRLASGKGWSAPSSLDCVGTGLGASNGARSTDIVISIATDDVVDSFVTSGRLVFEPASGGTTEAGTSDSHASTPSSMSCTAFTRGSNGQFRSISVEGVTLESRGDDNLATYGKSGDTAAEVLAGRVHPPSEAVAV